MSLFQLEKKRKKKNKREEMDQIYKEKCLGKPGEKHFF
jgi:hypothetical protein